SSRSSRRSHPACPTPAKLNPPRTVRPKPARRPSNKLRLWTSAKERSMTALREVARAKLNLTLEVLGRRPDGFHEIQSLVAFAGVSDNVELTSGNRLELAVDGPFAVALAGDNLITRAAEAAKAANPELRLGRFRLDKVLPVAAGLGGGSADAAAALRLIARANGGIPSEAGLTEFATKLGSYVSGCLKNKPAMITGRGEEVGLLRGFPSWWRRVRQPAISARNRRGLRLAQRKAFGITARTKTATAPIR